MRVTINSDFYIKGIAGRPVAGNTATILKPLYEGSGIVIAEIDGLAPYGWNGKLALPNGSYEILPRVKEPSEMTS